MIKKSLKKACTFLMGFALVLQMVAFPVCAASVENEDNSGNETIYFTNEDFLFAAQEAFEKGLITEEDYQTVNHMLLVRLGVKGENKIVKVGADTYDYYINNILWSAITALGTGAVGVIIGMIPGISQTAAAIIAAVAGGVGGTLLSADKGVIIRIKMIDTSCGVGMPNYVYQFVSIREQ